MLTQNDQKQLREKGITTETLEKQLTHFREGFPWADLVAPATYGEGIVTYTPEEADTLASFYDQSCQGLTVLKFVPASGAATRMFKHLFEFREKYDGSEEAVSRLEKDQGFSSVHYFLKHIREYAFAGEMEQIFLAKGTRMEEVLRNKDYSSIISCLLDSDGLDYASLPKGLILFHKYPEGPRTSLEEHLVEGATHARSGDGSVRIHFTVSPEHLDKFRKRVAQTAPLYEKKYKCTFDVTYSIQKPSTDTIAVDLNNQPFRNADGSLLFRPAGHGALIENLNDTHADLVFIKNIDNITGDRLRVETIRYKKVIAGLLLSIRDRVNDLLLRLDTTGPNPEWIAEAEALASGSLFIHPPEDVKTLSVMEQSIWWKNRLNRPVRVCGMVKNEGEPGGGPFLLRDGNGEISLQIVESSQINLKDPGQKAIVDQATHFNPVDLVCSLKDYKGNRFHLPDYVDHSTGFISVKSKDGRELKALELPGLWNGAMAKWLTVFVETPLITFNPVKTINDLLRPEHQ